jgi:hypothetical protein
VKPWTSGTADDFPTNVKGQVMTEVIQGAIELFKRTPILVIISAMMIILGVILLLIGASGDVTIGTFALKLPNIISQVTIAIVGIVFISFAIYLLKRYFTQAESSTPSSDVPSEPQKSLSSSGIVFLNKWPPGYERDFEMATELWLVGVSLESEVIPTENIIMLKDKLVKGHSINVLLTDPDECDVIKSVVKRSFKKNWVISESTSDDDSRLQKDIERKRREIRNTLQELCDLRKLSRRLHIRTIRYPLSYGVQAMNPGDKSSGVLYIKLYPYKIESVKPRFVLRAGHDEWYESFRQEMGELWTDGVEWNCA